jgi:hypothetical protein
MSLVPEHAGISSLKGLKEEDLQVSGGKSLGFMIEDLVSRI